MSGNEQNKATMLPLIFVVAAAMLLGWLMMWHLKHDAIVFFLAKIAYYQAWPFGWIDDYAVGRAAVEMATHPAGVKGGQVFSLLTRAGIYYSPVCVLFVGWRAWLAWIHPVTKISMIHDAESLLLAQSQHTPAIVPIVGRDLTNDKSPQWADSKHPEEWVVDRGVVHDEVLETDAVRELLLKDIGRPIASVTDLEPHERALFAAFAEKIWGEKDVYYELLSALNRSTAGQAKRAVPTPDFRLAQESFNAYVRHAESAAILQQHRYSTTFLMELLERARKTGVLPTSEFIWLKPYDRPLFYALNTVGRKVPFMESCAAFCQWRAERVAAANDIRLNKPFVERAVVALDKYLVDIGVTRQQEEF